MKTQVTITEITHDDLVNLLSTALSGSTYLTADYEEAVEHNEDDCYEDIMAKILLNGGKICITDHYAEDGEVYGDNPCKVNEDEDNCFSTTYFISLATIVTGLMRAASGTFNAGNDEWTEQTLRSARVSFNSFADEEDLTFDQVRADILMQIILFNEIVYG